MNPHIPHIKIFVLIIISTEYSQQQLAVWPVKLCNLIQQCIHFHLSKGIHGKQYHFQFHCNLRGFRMFCDGRLPPRPEFDSSFFYPFSSFIGFKCSFVHSSFFFFNNWLLIYYLCLTVYFEYRSLPYGIRCNT